MTKSAVNPVKYHKVQGGNNEIEVREASKLTQSWSIYQSEHSQNILKALHVCSEIKGLAINHETVEM